MTDWSRRPERGAAWLVRLMLWLTRHASWFADAVVLPGISLWFFACSPGARAASREYLAVVLGRTPRAWDVLRHVHVFARSILDRVLLLGGRDGEYQVEVEGLHHVEAVARGGGGGVLLGAHLGSFAVLRALAAQCPVPVKMLQHQANAGPFSTMLERMNAEAAAEVIPIGGVASMLRVHEAVASGALVGMLADRAPGGARGVAAPFFARPASFPAGPFILAANLAVPVLTFYGARTGRRRYRVVFAPFAERIVLQRETRQQDLTRIVGRYAAWLEEGCRAHPFNWFNFYPFWQSAPPPRAAMARFASLAQRGRSRPRAPALAPPG